MSARPKHITSACAVDDFHRLMTEWVQYVQNLVGFGYSDSTTLWRAVSGDQGGGEFTSRPPVGLRKLETHGALTRLVAAMGVLSKDDDARPDLSCLQALYLFGPEEAMTLNRKTRTKFYESCRTAEKLLLVEMKRH